MSIQHFNEARTIARTADQLGAALPKRIADALAHLDDLARSTPVAPRPGAVAADLAQHIGNPAAMDKALKTAATALATTDAEAKIRGLLAEACGARIRGMMKGQTEEIAASFGAALVDDLTTLSQTAGRLPAWFNPEQAASLDPITFAAWVQARDAYARIQSAETALAPLYSGAIDMDHRDYFPTTAAASLRFANPPKLTGSTDAYAFLAALNGRTERVQGLAGQGSTFVDGLFIPTVLAHAGATFEWATPTEVAERAERTIAGMVAGMVTREPETVGHETAAPIGSTF